jgi:SAM-dependent methyltransferase
LIDHKIMRRVAGYHDIRLDGILDLVVRARGASVFDVGCNRGLVAFELANNGAETVHGCDNYADGIKTAREIFADIRSVQSKFEIIDLTRGPPALRNVFLPGYDIVLLLATYHKLKRVMPASDLSELTRYLGTLTRHYLGWRATSDKPGENEREMAALDSDLAHAGLKRIHTSTISQELSLAAIWGRV